MAIDTIRSIIEQATVASLGTIDSSGKPFVTLVTIASSDPTHLIMLLSGFGQAFEEFEFLRR